MFSKASMKREYAKMQAARAAKCERRWPWSKLTKDELVAERERLQADPANKGDGLYLYNAPTRRKLEQIASELSGRVAS